MRKRIDSAPAWVFTSLLLVACGGDSSVQGPTGGSPPAPPTPAPSPALDFALVEGEWEGVMTTPDGLSSSMEVELERSARQGAAIGKVVYVKWDCEMSLDAVEAEPPSYTVDENFVSGPPGCAEGFGYLEHDPEAGTLEYTFVSHTNSDDTGTATLSRP